MSCERYVLRVPAPQSVNLIVPPNGPAVIAAPGTPQVTLQVPAPEERRLAVSPAPVARLLVQERVGPPGAQGPPGLPGTGSGLQKYLLAGLQDGLNRVFTSPSPFEAGTEWVSCNGIPNLAPDHYQVTGSDQITFSIAPPSWWILTIEF